MTTSLPRRVRTAAISVVAVTLTACGESTTAFDAIALSENTDEIINVMDQSPAMQSMDSLGGKMTAAAPGLGAAPLLSATLPTRLPTTGDFPAWAAHRLAAIRAAGPTFSVAAPEAVIPEAALGKTFTYNANTQAYELSDRTGAPSNGVRFILYAVNPVTHVVVTPLNEVGYVDLLDESSGSTAQLHLKAYITASGTAPLIDYTASATLQGSPSAPTGATVSATGHVSDGTTTVEFDLSQVYSTTSGVQVEYTLSVPEKDIDVTFEATLTLLGQATVKLTVIHGGNTTVVAASGTLASITGTIRHNGDLVMNISGSSDSPVFTDPSGNPPTEEQAAALGRLFEFADRLLERVDDMIAPAHRLLGVSAVVG